HSQFLAFNQQSNIVAFNWRRELGQIDVLGRFDAITTDDVDAKLNDGLVVVVTNQSWTIEIPPDILTIVTVLVTVSLVEGHWELWTNNFNSGGIVDFSLCFAFPFSSSRI
ncbi:hypothetical protein PENTCL1PPCAC_7341, partial [Pristionchus entomophagus]